MKKSTARILSGAVLVTAASMTAMAGPQPVKSIDLTNFRYQKESPSMFHTRQAKETAAFNARLDARKGLNKAKAFENPAPIFEIPYTDAISTIDAPNGELWYYTGEFNYKEIPPHDDVVFTDKILLDYTFNIYNSKMELIGTIKDEMDYNEGEVRTVLCEITPVATRNFFNTDDNIELMVGLAVNRDYETLGGGNNYRTLVYVLDGEKDEEGYDKVIDVLDDLVSDVVEGPATDGSDNFYITFMRDLFEPEGDGDSFWDYLLAQKASITVYGKALDDKGPREIFTTTLPLIQFPGDQQDVPVMMSTRRGDDVIFCISNYKEPFYNKYEDFTADMTMREGNSLVINLYKASETGLTVFSTTEIPMTLDPMNNAEGQPTCLFSYYSIGNLSYTHDILFDAPGASAEKPDFIVTKGNYQVSTDGVTNSYYTYKNDGSLKNTLFLYADGTRGISDVEGFEPQQLFVSRDAYGYIFNFVDLYSAKTALELPADYYPDEDSESELLTSNVDRIPAADSYQYVFELRYPLVDDNENDILRFMYIEKDGKWNHTDFVNMGQGVVYAQSYISQQALMPHAYAASDTPAYMMLIKRSEGEQGGNFEQLMVAECQTEENPEGKILLQLGPTSEGILASIVPEFAYDENPGRLFIYYRDDDYKLALDVYGLPLDEDLSGVTEIGNDLTDVAMNGSVMTAEGEITVFTLDGKLVCKGNGSIDFAGLEKGIYVVKAAGKSFKLVK